MFYKIENELKFVIFYYLIILFNILLKIILTIFISDEI